MDPSHEPVVPLLSAPSGDGGRQSVPISRPLQLALYILSILFLAAALSFIGYDLRQAYRDTLAYWEVRMSNSAVERVGYASFWLNERKTDTRAVARHRFTVRLLSTAANRSDSAEVRQAAEEVVERMARENGFLGGVVGDAECRIVAQTGMPEGAAKGAAEACQRALSGRNFGVWFAAAQPAHVWIYLYCPVFTEGAVSSEGQIASLKLGAVVMIAEPWKTLFPFLMSEDESRAATETLMVWQDGDETVVFSPRLSLQGVQPIFRRPASEATLESHAVRENNVEFGEFTDYRGTQVLGAARFIRQADASVIRKVDRAGALQEFHRRSLLEGLVGALFVLLMGSVMVVRQRHVATQDLKEMLRQQQALLDLRRQAEEALRQSDQRYKDFIAYSNEGIWRLEFEPPVPLDLPEEEVLQRLLQEGHFAESNAAFARDQGFSGPEEVVGKTMRDLLPLLDSDPERMESFRSAIRGKFQTRTVELRGLDRTGNLKHFVRTEVPIVEGGSLKRVWGISRDVTQVKRAEEALREREARLRNLSDNLPGGMVYQLDTGVDGQTRQFTYVSAGVGKLHEVTPQAVVQSPQLLYDQIVEGDRRGVAEREAQALSSLTPFIAEARFRLPSGATRWRLITSAPRRASNGHIICDGVELDITERKRVEEELRTSQERYRAFVANSSEGIWRYEAKQPVSTSLPIEEQIRHLVQFAYVAECNDALARMAGYERAEEMIGRRLADRVAEDPRNLDHLRAFVRSGYRLQNVETIGMDRKGKVHHYLNNYVGVVENGYLVRGWGVQRDITERKRAEEELAERLRFETLLSELSARFVNVPAEQLDDEIKDALRRVCECLGLEEATLWQPSANDPNLITLTHFYRPLELPPLPEQMDAREYFPWCYQQLITGKRDIVAVSSMKELPPEMARDQESWRRWGVKGALVYALRVGKEPPVGALAFDTVRAERTWPEQIVNRLQLVTRLFTNALARQRSERAQRESEQRFRSLSDASLEGNMIHDHGLILDTNLAFARLLGYGQPEELIGKNGLELMIAPESREVIRQRIRRREAGPIEVKCLRKDGTIFVGETDSRPLKYLGRDATIVSCRDITERKRAEEALAASELRYRALFTAANDAVFLHPVNPDGSVGAFIEVNDVATARLGYSAEELRTMTPADIDAPEFAQVAGRATEELRREGHATFEMVQVAKDGRRIPVELSARQFVIGGKPFIVSIARDITERKRAQAEVQHSLEQVRALAGRLQEIREEERKRVAREIHDQPGQALTAIKLDLCSLVREMGGDPEQPSKRAASILKLVDETIQSVRRISTDLRPGILDDLGLVAAIEWVGQDFEARTGTRCRLELPREDITVDPERATAIFRILQETLTNVARHAAASEVVVQLEKRDRGLTLLVRDNGKGMTADELSGRHSLGILGMRERALVFGGEVITSSAPGMGTTVKVRIPEAGLRNGELR